MLNYLIEIKELNIKETLRLNFIIASLQSYIQTLCHAVSREISFFFSTGFLKPKDYCYHAKFCHPETEAVWLIVSRESTTICSTKSRVALPIVFCFAEARCLTRRMAEREGKRGCRERDADWPAVASWRCAAANRRPQNSLRQSVIDFTLWMDLYNESRHSRTFVGTFATFDKVTSEA